MKGSPERFALTFPQDIHFCISKLVLGMARNLRGVRGLWSVVSSVPVEISKHLGSIKSPLSC